MFEHLPLAGLVKIVLHEFPDNRGTTVELFKQSVFRDAGLPDAFAQDLFSISKRDVIRGMHYQKNPAAQGKLVRCIEGEIYDIVVDIRKSSPTFGRSFGLTLSGSALTMLYIPVGFAHGYVVRSETASLLYKLTSEYSQEHERGVRWNDPDLGLEWRCKSPLVSAKDRDLPLLSEADTNFE